jgi:hypothetical protein
MYHESIKNVLLVNISKPYVFKCIYDFKGPDLGAGHWKLSIHNALNISYLSSVGRFPAL